jgi:hypothetical protein
MATTKRKKATPKVEDAVVTTDILSSEDEVLPIVEEKISTKEYILYNTKEIKMDIGNHVGFDVPDETLKVEIENLGVGEVYYATDDDNIIMYVDNSTIKTGETKIFEGISKIVMTSHCRPIIVIRMYK